MIDNIDSQGLGDMAESCNPATFGLLAIAGKIRSNEGTISLTSKPVNDRPALVWDEQNIRVVGTQFDNEDGSSRQEFLKRLSFAIADDEIPTLELRREPTNKYDSNAIGVFYNGSQVGHIPARLAVVMAEDMDSGAFKPFATVSEVKADKKGLVVINVHLFEYLDPQ